LLEACDGEVKSIAYKRFVERRRFAQKFGLGAGQMRESEVETPPYVKLEARVPAENWVPSPPGRFMLAVRNTRPENTKSTTPHSKLPEVDQNLGRALRSRLGGRLAAIRLETVPGIHHDYMMLLCDDGDSVVVLRSSEA